MIRSKELPPFEKTPTAEEYAEALKRSMAEAEEAKRDQQSRLETEAADREGRNDSMLLDEASVVEVPESIFPEEARLLGPPSIRIAKVRLTIDAIAHGHADEFYNR